MKAWWLWLYVSMLCQSSANYGYAKIVDQISKMYQSVMISSMTRIAFMRPVWEWYLADAMPYCYGLGLVGCDCHLINTIPHMMPITHMYIAHSSMEWRRKQKNHNTQTHMKWYSFMVNDIMADFIPLFLYSVTDK